MRTANPGFPHYSALQTTAMRFFYVKISKISKKNNAINAISFAVKKIV